MKRLNPAWVEGIIIGLALGALLVALGKGCGLNSSEIPNSSRIEAIGSEG